MLLLAEIERDLSSRLVAIVNYSHMMCIKYGNFISIFGNFLFLKQAFYAKQHINIKFSGKKHFTTFIHFLIPNIPNKTYEK